MAGHGEKRPTKKVRRSAIPETGQSSGTATADRMLPPWPRQEGTRFLPDRGSYSNPARVKDKAEYMARDVEAGWQEFHSIFYDQLLKNKMVPTKFLCTNTLHKLGLLDDVNGMIERLGLGTFMHRSFPLYPEPVRQLLASCDVHMAADPHAPVHAYEFTFLYCGALYRMSIRDICRIYGFNTLAEGRLPSQEGSVNSRLWDILANGGFMGRECKLTHIRNPAIRVFAKLLGSTIFGKEESGSLTRAELEILHYAIVTVVPDLYGDGNETFREPLDINWGYVFANLLTDRRFRGRAGTTREETLGNLLTPIFIYHRLDLSNTEKIEKIHYMDDRSLTHYTYLKAKIKWRYYTRDWKSAWCKLPAPHVTSLTTRSNVLFEPHIDHPEIAETEEERPPRRTGSRSYADYPDSPPAAPPRPSAARQSTTRPSTSQAAAEIHMEDIIPDYTAEYDLPPLSTDFTDRDFQLWHYENEKRKHSMLRQMWEALKKIKVPVPSCLGQSSGTRAEPSVRETDDEPDIAGHGYERGGGDQRLPRRRREPGQSRSASPEES